MPLLTVIIALAVIGVLLWLVNTYIPMEAWIKKVINIVVIIGVILWLLSITGLLGTAKSITVPHVSNSSSPYTMIV